MLTIHLLRHGDSQFGGADIDRTLSGLGLEQLKTVLADFRPVDGSSLRILTSSALRCIQSAEVVRGTMDCPPPLQLPELYLATQHEVLSQLSLAAQSTSELMVVGHNPGLSLLAQSWSGGRDWSLPTAGLASFELNCEDSTLLEVADSTPLGILLP